MKKDKIMWGLLFLLAAVCLIAGKLDLLKGFDVISILLTIFLAGIFIKNLLKINFTGMLFSIAFLCILYDKQLGIEALTPWTVLVAAALGSIGLTLIFPRKRIRVQNAPNGHYQNPNEHFERVINEEDKNYVKCDVHFSSAVKYVNSDSFEGADVSCSFGAAKVYFDNALLKSNQAFIRLNVSFAGVELYIPRTWKIINDANVSLGAVEEKGVGGLMPGAPQIRLYGDVSLGGVTIHYV